VRHSNTLAALLTAAALGVGCGAGVPEQQATETEAPADGTSSSDIGEVEQALRKTIDPGTRADFPTWLASNTTWTVYNTYTTTQTAKISAWCGSTQENFDIPAGRSVSRTWWCGDWGTVLYIRNDGPVKVDGVTD
jgi:hypothetical protein